MHFCCRAGSPNQVLASGASFIFFFFFFQAKQQRFRFERAQMQPQPVLHLGAAGSLCRCSFLCGMRWFGFYAQPGQRGGKKIPKTTTLQQKESWRDGEKAGDEERWRMQRRCSAVTPFQTLTGLISRVQARAGQRWGSWDRSSLSNRHKN